MENCFLGRGRTHLCNTFLFFLLGYSTFPSFFFQLSLKVPFSCCVVISTCPTCTVAENKVFTRHRNLTPNSQPLSLNICQMIVFYLSSCFQRFGCIRGAERNGMNANETKCLQLDSALVLWVCRDVTAGCEQDGEHQCTSSTRVKVPTQKKI